MLGERAGLRAAFADAAGHQQRVLDDLLAFNAGTEFGRAHGFDSIRTRAEYRKAVPIRDYQAPAPAIERMAGGERNVLTADDPAVYFTSSGSTGAHKKIPVTPRFMATTFLLRGEEDELVRPEEAVRLATQLNAPLITVPGAGHRLPREAPGAVGTALLEFLEKL